MNGLRFASEIWFRICPSLTQKKNATDYVSRAAVFICFCTRLSDPKYLIMAQDIKPRVGCIEDWRLDIGRKLASFAESLEEKVVVMISGDLSHCHPTDCTDPMYLPNSRWLMDCLAAKLRIFHNNLHLQPFPRVKACASFWQQWQPLFQSTST